MVDDIGGEVKRYECPECGEFRLLAGTPSEVECEECSTTMEFSRGKVMENPASAMSAVSDDNRETKSEEDLRYR
ncbi:MAG: hypothetical protein ABEH78_09460 [Haloferacaceae archaeon]